MLKKEDLNKGLDFVNWSMSNGYDIIKIATNKKYMAEVVEKYKERNDSNDTSN